MAHLLRLGVLASGSGSNLQSILDACAQHRWDVPARYNIAPSQDIPAIRVGAGGKKELVMLRWGLIPSWASDAAIGNRMINARSETASTKRDRSYSRSGSAAGTQVGEGITALFTRVGPHPRARI